MTTKAERLAEGLKEITNQFQKDIVVSTLSVAREFAKDQGVSNDKSCEDFAYTFALLVVNAVFSGLPVPPIGYAFQLWSNEKEIVLMVSYPYYNGKVTKMTTKPKFHRSVTNNNNHFGWEIYSWKSFFLTICFGSLEIQINRWPKYNH